MSLAKGCTSKGTMIHEMMHTLGFLHEHQRPDRNKNINIYMNNVKPKKETRFQIRDGNVLSKYFDYHSITMYGGKTFSKYNNSITIASKDGHRLYHPRLEQHLSEHDVYEINKLYKWNPCQEHKDCCSNQICYKETCTIAAKGVAYLLFAIYF